MIHPLRRRITRQGFPTANEFSGIDLLTTLPAPITEFLPIVTPGKIITPPPIQTLSSIVTGKAYVQKNALPLFFCQFSTRMLVSSNDI